MRAKVEERGPRRAARLGRVKNRWLFYSIPSEKEDVPSFLCRVRRVSHAPMSKPVSTPALPDPVQAGRNSRHTSVDSMEFLGLETDNRVFLGTSDGLMNEPHTGPVPWRVNRNGNPPDVYRKVKSLLSDSVNVLFVIERDVNRNVVVYGVDADPSSTHVIPPPVRTHAFWVMIPDSRAVETDVETDVEVDLGDEEEEEEGLGDVTTEDLTLVERTYAYGIKSHSVTYTEEEILIKAFEQQPIRVRMHEDGQYHATLQIGGTDMVLNRIYICTEKRSLLWPTTTELHLEVREKFDSPSSITYFFKV